MLWLNVALCFKDEFEKQLDLSLTLIGWKTGSFRIERLRSFSAHHAGDGIRRPSLNGQCEGKQLVHYCGRFSHFICTTAAPFVLHRGRCAGNRTPLEEV
jgi:hypothetical protein